MSFVPLLVVTLLSAAGDEVVARVGAEPITAAMVTRRVEAAARAGQPWTRSQAVDSLVDDLLLAAEARRLGIGPKEVASFADREVRKWAAGALVDSFVATREPDDAALRQMFHATADFVSWEFLAYASEEDARAARQRIEKGASFEAESRTAVASRLYPKPSDAPLSMRAQIMGPIGAALFAAAPGAIVGPVESDKAWHVARVLAKAIGSDAEFAARRPALVLAYRKQVRGAARSHLVEQLKTKAGVKLDDAFLRSLSGAQASPEQLQHVLATVGGTPVRYADVYPQIRGIGGQKGHMASAAVKVALATEIVNERVLEAFAAERGFDKSPEAAAIRADVERNGLGALASDRIRAAAPAPTKREVEAHYAKNRARYALPLDKIRPRVEAEVANEKREQFLAARMKELRAGTPVTIDRAALARAGE